MSYFATHSKKWENKPSEAGTIMQWKNAQRDQLPLHLEEVLISVDGIYYLSIFDSDKKLFEIIDSFKEAFFKVDENLIYWTEYHNTAKR